MDATEVVETVTDEYNTELSRLGSSKSLYAATGGEMEPEAVLEATADAAAGAADVIAAWSGADGEPFAAAAEREQDHYETIAEELDDHEPGERPAAVGTMATYDEPAGRLGALVGWTLVAERTANQATGFFTGQADPGTASLFRGFGRDHETTREAALSALDADDLDAARAAAGAVVEAAYREYVDRLEAMGVNPKPVC